MHFNEFINSKRKELGMSVDDLVKASGVPKGTLSKITSGINTNPTLSTVEAICKALGCSLSDAVGASDEPVVSSAELSGIKKYRALDEHGKKMVGYVLNEEYTRCMDLLEEASTPTIEIKLSRLSVSAGTGDYLDGESYEHITVRRTDEAERADFAVKVNGRSMEPTYSDGDILLVDACQQVGVGDIGVFMLNSDGYVKEFGGDRLISHNEEYDDILLHEYDVIRCAGRVIGVAERIG